MNVPTEQIGGRTKDDLKELKRNLELQYGIEIPLDDGSLAYLHKVLSVANRIETIANELNPIIAKFDGASHLLTRLQELNIPSEIKLIKEHKIEVGDFWKRVHMAGAAVALVICVSCTGYMFYVSNKVKVREGQIDWFQDYVRSSSKQSSNWHKEYIKQHPYPKNP